MYAIQKTETQAYFSLMGSPHFTYNEGIITLFDTEEHATLCIEHHIDAEQGFETFGMIDCEVVKYAPCMSDLNAAGDIEFGDGVTKIIRANEGPEDYYFQVYYKGQKEDVMRTKYVTMKHYDLTEDQFNALLNN